MLMYFQLNALVWSVCVDVLSVECLCVEWQCSAQVFKRAGCHLKRANLAR